MPASKEEAQRIVGAAVLQGAREGGKDDAKSQKEKLDPRAQEVKDLIDQAVATPGVQLAITVYRRSGGAFRTGEKWIGIIDYATPQMLKLYGVEPIVQDYSGGGSYRLIIRVPQLDIEREVYVEVGGDPLEPKHLREQAAQMGITVEQLKAQQRGTAIPGLGPQGPGTPQLQQGGLPTQPLGMQPGFQQPGYGQQQPYGFPQVHMGAPYGGYGPQQHPWGPNYQQPWPQQPQPPQDDPKDKVIEKLMDKALNQPVQAPPNNDEGNKVLEAMTQMFEKMNQRWEKADEDRRNEERRREDREAAARERQEDRERHEKEMREMELRHEREREEHRREADERRWKEQLESSKNNKNPTTELIAALAPIASGLIAHYGSKEDASVAMMRILSERPTNEDRLAKIYEVLGNNTATQVGLIGSLLNSVLADKTGEDRPAWADILMQIIDQAGDVTKVALGGAMDAMEEGEEGDEGEGPRRLPPHRGLAPPPGMAPQQPQQPQQQAPGQPQNAAEAAAQARARIAAAQRQMAMMQQQQGQAPAPEEGMVIDVPPEQQLPKIEHFDSAMQTLFSMVSGGDDPHEIAFLLWKHAASGVRSAVEWFNHGVEASRYLLGGLRSNDQITVTDERIMQVGLVIQEFCDYQRRNGSPEEWAKKHNVQRGMPKSTRIDPVRDRQVPTQHATTASLDGQGQATFGAGQATEVKEQGGEIKVQEVKESEKAPEGPTEFDQETSRQSPLNPDRKPARPPVAAPENAIESMVDNMTARARAKRTQTQSTEPAPTVNPALDKKPPPQKMAEDQPPPQQPQTKPKVVPPPDDSGPSGP